jgi:hypothetical protein
MDLTNIKGVEYNNVLYRYTSSYTSKEWLEKHPIHTDAVLKVAKSLKEKENQSNDNKPKDEWCYYSDLPSPMAYVNE